MDHPDHFLRKTFNQFGVYWCFVFLYLLFVLFNFFCRYFYLFCCVYKQFLFTYCSHFSFSNNYSIFSHLLIYSEHLRLYFSVTSLLLSRHQSFLNLLYIVLRTDIFVPFVNSSLVTSLFYSVFICCYSFRFDRWMDLHPRATAAFLKLIS